HHAHEDDRPRRKHHVSKRRSSGNCKTYRTYDAESGTYRGYDGRVHSCS
ncbi:MAG: BA14K family protein, partial [Bradyrhizobium sp.]|nr:BA14K family protein [Bradyrhizobium sp.]